MSRTQQSILSITAGLLLAVSMSAFGQGIGTPGNADKQKTEENNVAGTAMEKKSTQNNTAKSATADQTFAKKAAQGGKAEVELGNLALQKASSDDVKKFAQRMVDDHTKADQELKSATATMKLPDKPDAKEQKEKDRLSKLSGAEFDRAYMDHMVQDHTKDVEAFRKEARTGQDAVIKDFASKTLPTLEEHLKQAKDVQAKVKSSAKNEGGQTSQSARNSSKPKY